MPGSVESGAVVIRRRKVTTYEWRCRCERCGYAWRTLGADRPTRCPGCKARNFDKPARAYTRRRTPS